MMVINLRKEQKMKNRYFILVFLLALIVNACKDDKEMVQYSPQIAKASSLLTPQNGGTYELLSTQDTSSFETFSWTASDYGIDLAREYALQLGLEGTNFVAPVVMTTTPLLNYKIKVGELNLLLTDLGLTAGNASNIELRVRTTVANPAVDTLYSDVISFAITPYNYTKPNLTSPVAGNYELELDTLHVIPFEKFEWDVVNYGAAFIASYVLEFDSIGNGFANAVELYSGTDNSYTPTNFELNNLMIGRGFEAGTALDVEFRVRANTDGRGKITSDIQAYNIKTYTAELQVAPLYLVGDATLAGWVNTNGLEIIWDKDNSVYSIITDFKAGGMKILEVSGQWAPQWGDDGTNTGKLSYRPTESVPDPAQIPSPGTGSFKLTVDIVNLTYSFTAQ